MSFAVLLSCMAMSKGRSLPTSEPTDLPLQVEKTVNKLTLRIPHQLFIGGSFMDAESGKTFDTINPTDESVSVARAQLSPTSLVAFSASAPWPVSWGPVFLSELPERA